MEDSRSRIMNMHISINLPSFLDLEGPRSDCIPSKLVRQSLLKSRTDQRSETDVGMRDIEAI